VAVWPAARVPVWPRRPVIEVLVRPATVIEVWQRHARQSRCNRLFDTPQILFLFRCDEREGRAGRLRSGRPADAMNVVFRHVGNIEIHDVAQGGNVDAARGDISSHEDTVLPALEPRERLGSLRLRAIAVDALDLDTGVGEKLGQAVGAMLRAREDQRVVHVLPMEQMQHQGWLEMLWYGIHRMRDPNSRRRPPLDVDGCRRLQHLLRQLCDWRRHRRAEEQRLPFVCRRKVLQHTPDVGQEAHVQHAVGFIQHQVLQTAELCIRRSEVIEQPAGGGDDDVDAAPKGVFLRAHAHTAENRRRCQRRVHGQIVEILDNLRGQLPRWREHERPCGPSRFADESVQNREEKRCGLSTAGHRARQQILARHGQGNRISLNGCRSRKTEVLEPLKQARMQPEFREWHGTL